MRRETTEGFIEKAKKVHGDTYTYDKVKYMTAKIKVTITCSKHGDFPKTPTGHLSGQGCPKCGHERGHKKLSLSTEEFVEKAKKVHGDLYDYSKSEISSLKSIVTITCKKHGDFESRAEDHVRGKGCQECGRKKTVNSNRVSLDKALEKAKEAHGDMYDYSRVEFKRVTDKVTIGCKKHGDFKQAMNVHYNGSGCPECSLEKQTQDKYKDTEHFINVSTKVHGDKYDYSLVDYKGCDDKVKIICPTHGVFEQNSKNHFAGKGCSKCSEGNISKKEIEVYDFLKQYVPVKGSNRKLLKNHELDMVIASKRLAIEFDGIYYHSDEFLDKNYHLNKTELCEKQGYQLIHIFEDEWDYKQDIVKSRLLNLIGETERKIYARKTQIKEVSYKDASDFLNKNHIQGNVNGKHRYGLFIDEELVSIMTFGSLRKALGETSKENHFELLRFCNKLNTNVVGGASKLFKHFIKQHNPEKIKTYADRRWSTGKLYKTLGFEELKSTAPGYFYVKSSKREFRFKFRKSELVKQGFDPNKTEKQIMKERGYKLIYDCGNKKYEYNKPKTK